MPGDVMPLGLLLPEAAHTTRPFCHSILAAYDKEEYILLSFVPTDILTIFMLYFSLFSISHLMASKDHLAVPLPVSSSILRQTILHDGAMPLNLPFER